jgi:hypothetical protein
MKTSVKTSWGPSFAPFFGPFFGPFLGASPKAPLSRPIRGGVGPVSRPYGHAVGGGFLGAWETGCTQLYWPHPEATT